MSAIAIHVENLSKRYRIGPRFPYRALRDTLTDGLYAPFRFLRSQTAGIEGSPSVTHRAGSDDWIWALREVCLAVKEGEAVGLIGRNGAGKTTLLKILARITKPTTGRAEIRGRLGSLLEVGTGFHGELTGRENIYLSGAILGMRKRELDRKFDEIIAFAEIAEFLDTPLKHYSSGMQTRLAFAVAAHLEPEILLVDEVLAVGDLSFQKKCLGKMQEVSMGGRTVVFVSHQMNQIRRLCERAVWLEGGCVEQVGRTPEVVGAYEAAMTSPDWSARERAGAPSVKSRFSGWRIAAPVSCEPHLLTTLGEVMLEFTVHVQQPLRHCRLGISLHNNEGLLIWARDANDLALDPGTSRFCFTFPMLPLRPGIYSWQISLWGDDGCLDFWYAIPEMNVATESQQHPEDMWNGVLNVPCEFAILAEKDSAIVPQRF